MISTKKTDELLGIVKLDNDFRLISQHDVIDSMKLGYAITLHKAQGSQFPRIVVVLKSGCNVDRAWLYTAITRAETEIHIVGSSDDFKRITEAESHTDKRNSYLVELLKKSNK